MYQVISLYSYVISLSFPWSCPVAVEWIDKLCWLKVCVHVFPFFLFSCYFLDVKYIFNKSTFCCRITTIVVVRIDSHIDGSRADAAFSYFALGRLSEHRIVFTDKTVSLTHILAMYTLTHMPTIYCWRREFFFCCCCCFLQLKISFFFFFCVGGMAWFDLSWPSGLWWCLIEPPFSIFVAHFTGDLLTRW